MRRPFASEAQFQTAVIELFEVFKWKTYHNPDSRRSTPGFPDLVCVHERHGVVFLELKTERGRVSPAQVEWQEAINATRRVAPMMAAFVVRPSDWDIIEALALRGADYERATS